MTTGAGLGWSLAALFLGLQQPPSQIDSLQWLAGCWTMTRGPEVVEEHWMRPSGGTMLGMGRTVRAGKTTEFEYVQIREDSGRLVYDARPSGQAPAVFPLLKIGDSEVVFEDQAHDFPQRVIYRRNADGTVAARIEGSKNGQVRGIDFPYQKCR
jgi:hypothetical protein